jgi:hypothetical protein
VNGSIHSELAKAIMSGRLEAAGRAAGSARNSWPGNQTHPGPGTSRSQDASRGTPPQRQPLASGVSPWPPANHLTVAATVDTGDPGRGNRAGRTAIPLVTGCGFCGPGLRRAGGARPGDRWRRLVGPDIPDAPGYVVKNEVT